MGVKLTINTTFFIWSGSYGNKCHIKMHFKIYKYFCQNALQTNSQSPDVFDALLFCVVWYFLISWINSTLSLEILILGFCWQNVTQGDILMTPNLKGSTGTPQFLFHFWIAHIVNNTWAKFEENDISGSISVELP